MGGDVRFSELPNAVRLLWAKSGDDTGHGLLAHMLDVAAVADWSPAQAVDALQKVCHDQLALQVGGEPRFFPAQALVRGTSLPSLSHWAQSLQRSARTADHPFQAGLMLEALVGQAREALAVQRS